MWSKTPKSLDRKLEDILANPSTSKEFILADAKDADMAFGITAPGLKRDPEPTLEPTPASPYKSLEEYREQIRSIVDQGLVDIMLMSASNVEQLAINEKLFELSAVTPAARANDASDVWVIRGGSYVQQPSRPFRSAAIDHIMYGTLTPALNAEVTGADLGLYSVTWNNDIEHDHATLVAYKEFREEAELKGFRHFLEVFPPNASNGLEQADIPHFINDHIIRTLAGVATAGRPVFLKIAYQGPAAMEELASFDPNLIVGILGGSAGTTYDAFHLIAEAKKYGARVALYGRKINGAEHPLTFVDLLRKIADGEITPRDAVWTYHDELREFGIRAYRTIEDDLRLTETHCSYGGAK